MAESAIEYHIKEFDTVSSTLDVAASPAYTHGDVIVAAEQTAGRGQRGSQWCSRRGDNLTFTIVVEPRHIKVCQQFRVSMIAALSTAVALQKCGVEARIKWPNDIYVGDKKICGMLIEHFFSSEFLDKTIIGIGVNVAQTEFDATVANPTSLYNLSVTKFTATDILDFILSEFSNIYGLSEQQISDTYLKNLYRIDGFYPYCDDKGRFEAKIDGVDPHSGRITLVEKNGTKRSFYFKEIRYIIGEEKKYF